MDDNSTAVSDVMGTADWVVAATKVSVIVYILVRVTGGSAIVVSGTSVSVTV